MRWADWIVALFLPSVSLKLRRRTRLNVDPLEGRDVPSGAGDVVTTQPPNPPLPQIGDYVWKDANGNGFQDNGEAGLGLVTMQLFQGDKLVGTTITDSLGKYAFNKWNVNNGTADPSDDGLKPNTVYQIRIAGDQAALAGLRPTLANQGSGIPDELRDSDNVATATGSAIDFTMGPADIYYHYDAGFAPAASVGNMIWKDANNNGKLDKSEAGIAGVTVRLLDATGTTQVAMTTTGPDGSYLFSGLLPGTYIVEVAATNFATGGMLAGYASSNGKSGQVGDLGIPDPETVSIDGIDHGAMLNGVAQSSPITLSANSMENKTIDFGFFQSSSLSGKVFVDKNGNGRIDPEDTTGLAGIKIEAAGPAGVISTFTDTSGSYAFANLPAGSYTVTEKAQPGGYRSSTPDLANMNLTTSGASTLQFGESAVVDLRVAQTASRRSVGIGSVITLTYRIKNLGALGATGVLLNVPLPSGLRFVSATGGTYDAAMHRFSLGTLAPGAEAVVSIRVRAAKAGNFRSLATASATETEAALSNNASSVMISTLSPTAHSKVSASNWMLGSAHKR